MLEKDYKLKSHQKWEVKNKQKCITYSRRWNLKRFGITIAEYENLLSKQKGKCAICGITEKDLGRKLSVDHCHKIGKVRGLLCHKCNTGIGFFKEKPENFLMAIKYLEKDNFWGKILPKKKELKYLGGINLCQDCQDQSKCQGCSLWNDYNQAIDDCKQALLSQKEGGE